MSKSRIIITGASGFLGRHVADLLKHHDCAFLLNPASSMNPTEPGQQVFYSVEDLHKEFPSVDVVVHLAAFIPYGKLDEPSDSFEIINVQLTQRLALAYPEARWVFASSVSVYGQCEDSVITTKTKVMPNTRYAASKWKAEQVVAQLENSIIVRFSSIIGKGMKPISVIPKWIEQARSQKYMSVWGKGARTQNYLDVRDAAALIQILTDDDLKGIVLGVSRQEHSNLAVAQMIAEALPSEIKHTPHADDSGVSYDDHITHERIGFIPKFELRETIRDMIIA